MTPPWACTGPEGHKQRHNLSSSSSDVRPSSSSKDAVLSSTSSSRCLVCDMMAIVGCYLSLTTVVDWEAVTDTMLCGVCVSLFVDWSLAI